MTDSEITTTILREIRDQLAQTNELIDRSMERADANFDRLEQRTLVSETILRAVQGQLLALDVQLRSDTIGGGR